MTDTGDDKTQPQLRDYGVTAVLRCKQPSVIQDAAAHKIVLDGTELTIGRGSDNTVKLDIYGISRHHARLYLSEGRWHVEDLGSTNGTRVNNNRITTKALSDGDSVAFGRVGYAFLTAQAATGSFASRLAGAPIGDVQRTLVISPARRIEQAGSSVSSQTPRLPGSEQFYDTGTYPRHAPSAGSSGRSGLRLWALVLVSACAAGAAAAYFLGLF